LLIYEGLTCDYPSANDSLHTFVVEGVPDNAAAAARRERSQRNYGRLSGVHRRA
jgi:hypothetical protein